MVDIFDEVDEDLRAERAGRLLKKYAWVIVALAVLTVGASAGWQLWTHYRGQQDAAAAERFIAAQNAIELGGSGATEPMRALEQLAATGPEGYATLARLRVADLKAEAGDVPGAVAQWNAVAADANADHLLRDYASLAAVQHQLDHGDPAQLEGRLKPLSDLSNPWSRLAREQLALLDLRQGKAEAARATLQALSIDIDAPSGLRARAAALLAGLGSPDQK